jgi:hypothetical protein
LVICARLFVFQNGTSVITHISDLLHILIYQSAEDFPYRLIMGFAIISAIPEFR